MPSEVLNFILNNESVTFSGNPGMVTLDFLREQKGLKGTKEGCREGDCGSCSVLLGKISGNKMTYKSVVSCLLPIGELKGKHLVTIEGLNDNNINIVQKLILDEGATQCGFCTPGMVISFTSFLLSGKSLSYKESIEYIGGNICRCTGYNSLKNVGRRLSEEFCVKILGAGNRIKYLVDLGILPEYFTGIKKRLTKMVQKNELKFADVPESFAVLGGGTDLFVQKPEEVLDKHIIFLSRYDKLKGIWTEKDTINIKTATTVEELKDSNIIKRNIPNWEEYLLLISSTQIRNQATLGGNLMNASPIGDLSIIFLSLNSTINILSGKNIRKLPLNRFFVDYKKLNLNKGELIGWISFPKLGNKSYFNFEKVSRRKYLDIASVNSAINIKVIKNKIARIDLAVGGVAPVPFYPEKTVEFLRLKEINIVNIKEACELLLSETSPISDVRGSIEYKRLLLRQIFYTHFIKLYPEIVSMEDLL